MRKIIFFFLAVFSATNLSWAMQCGSDSITVGKTVDEVIESCGTPIFREDLAAVSVQAFTEQKDAKGQVWVYAGNSLGAGSNNFQLIFIGEKLVEINILNSQGEVINKSK